MYQLIDLTGKRIVITGASQGIGQSTAELLSQLGAKLILIARSEEKLKQIISNLEGTDHSYYVMDLSDTGAIEDKVKEIVSKYGAVDGLVYCAGISDDRPLMQQKPEIVDKVLNLNLCSFIELVRCFAKRKRFNAGMSVVGVSSMSAICGGKAHEAYAASKAGMNGAMRCMAKELAEKEIRVNTVAPGMIRTAMYDVYLEGSGGTDGEANRRLLQRQYLGIGEPKDVAAAIAFLLSAASRFVTGVCFPVDGGRTSN